MSRAFGKRLAALVLAPVLVLTTFVIVVPAVLTVTAPPSVAAEASNAAPFTGPIGSENDPWPQSFPRDSNVVHKSNLEKTRIALVFDFDARYTWESMGGNVIPGGVNFDQSKQIKKSLQNLEGAPVRVGIYTFDQFDRSAGNYPDRAWGNTPDLPATSLENKEGFDKVMAKLDSLDATGGTGRRKGSNHSDDFSNQEQGLQKVINDMDKYHYTDVFLFTTGMPNRCGEHDQGCTFDWSKLRPDQQEYLKQSGAWDGSNNGVHDWDKYTYSRMGIIAAALKAQELQAKGAKLRIMQMYTYSGSGNECPTKREQYALNYAGYMLGDKITYQCGDQKVPGGQSTTHDRITVTVPENIKDQWINIRHAGHFNTWYSDQPKNSDGSPDGDLIKKCNQWDGVGVKYEGNTKFGGDDGNQHCNHVRDGKFGNAVVKWLQEAKGLAVVYDQIDQNRRFIKPNTGRAFKIAMNQQKSGTAGTAEVERTTEGDGMFDVDGTRQIPAKVVLETDKYPLEQLTPFEGTIPTGGDKRGKPGGKPDGKLHNARCIGWNAGANPETFYPENVNNNQGIPLGFQFTNEQLSRYQLAKCAMYSRPFQEVQVIKRAATDKADPINSVLGRGNVEAADGKKVTKPGATYKFEWKCTDPLSHKPDNVISSSEGINEAERTFEIKGKVNNLEQWQPLGIGEKRTFTDEKTHQQVTKSMLPVGARCEVTENISLPSGYYSEKAENDFKAAQLYTSENRVTGRNYRIEIPTDAPPAVKKDPELVGQEKNEGKISFTNKKTQKTMETTVSQALKSHTFGATINYEPGSTTESGASPISQLVSTTTYKSKKAGIKFTLKLANLGKDPAFNQIKQNAIGSGKTLPVYYNCRFMPLPDKPLELPETNEGYIPTPVQSGWIYVPVKTNNAGETTGEAYLGYEGVNPTNGELPKRNGTEYKVPAWPVGTHCLFDTVAPPEETGQTQTSKPLQLPGFKSTDSYKSTLCPGQGDGSGLGQCRSKYFWVGSDKDHEIELTQDFERMYGKLQVTKLLQGAADKDKAFDAKSQGVGHGYRMVLNCTQNRVHVPLEGDKNPGMTVWQGKPVTVGGIPAQADCTITEDLNDTKINNVDIHAPEPQTVKITDLAQANPVTVTNTLSYKKQTLQVQYNTVFNQNVPEGLKDSINKREETLTVNCTDMDGREVKFSGGSSLTVSGPSGTASVSNVPAGSKCTVSADTTGFPVSLAGKTYNIQVESTPVEVSIPDSGEAKATVTARFSTSPAGEISIASAVKQWPAYSSVKNTLNGKKLRAAITCGGKTYWQGDLDLNNNPLTVTAPASAAANSAGNTAANSARKNAATQPVKPNIPENTSCNLEVNSGGWPEQVAVTTAMRGGNSSTQSASKWTTGSSLSFPFTSPGSTTSTTLTLEHRFAEEMTPATLTLREPSMWTSAKPGETDTSKRIPVPESWKKALVEANSGISANVRCGFNSDTFKDTFSSPLRFDKATDTITTQVPKGWDCGFTVDRDALGIPGTTLRQVTWKVDSNGDKAEKTEGYEYSTTDNQGSPNLSSASSPSTPSVSGQASAPKKPVNISWKSQKGLSVSLERDYRMQLASFNVKKKVGGEGVGAIPAEFQFQIHYSCTLNGKPIPLPEPAAINSQQFPTTVAKGTEAWDAQTALEKNLRERLAKVSNTSTSEGTDKSISVVRFQQGEWHPIDALPAGAVCTLYEDSKAKVDSSRLDNYWTHTSGYRGREPEVTCQESSQGCSLLSDTATGGMNKVQIALSTDVPPQKNTFYRDGDRDNATGNNENGVPVPLNPHVPKILPENFSGTMVPWNNYTFNKAKNLQLTMKIRGNGQELVAGQTLNTRLYCKPPAMRDQEHHLVKSQSMKGRNVINSNLVFAVPAADSKRPVTATGAETTPSPGATSTPDSGSNPNTPGTGNRGTHTEVENQSSGGEIVLVATSDLRLPVDYKCVIAQKNFALGDGELTTVITKTGLTPAKSTFDVPDGSSQSPADGKSNSATEKQLEDLFTSTDDTPGADPSKVEEFSDDSNVFQGADENFIAGFQMPHELTEDSTVAFSLTNTILRRGVNLNINHTLLDSVKGYYNLGSKLSLNQGYTLAYDCEDRYLREKAPVKNSGATGGTTASSGDTAGGGNTASSGDTVASTRPKHYRGYVKLATNAKQTPVFAADNPSLTTVASPSGHAAGVAESSQPAGASAAAGSVPANSPVFMPASSSCQFQLENNGSDPLAGYPTVKLFTSVRATGDLKFDGRFHNEKRVVSHERGKNTQSGSVSAQTDSDYLIEVGHLDDDKTRLNPVVFEKDPGKPSNPASQENPGNPENDVSKPFEAQLDFTTWYFTGQQQYSLATYTYGTNANEAIPADSRFDYSYTCTYPKLPITISSAGGSVNAGLGQQAYLGTKGGGQGDHNVVPEGTTCDITGTVAKSKVPYLKVVTNLAPNTPDIWETDENDSNNAPATPNTSGAATSAPDNPKQPDFSQVKNWAKLGTKDNPSFQVKLDGTKPDAIIVHIVYRNGAELHVRRVDAQKQTQAGGRFDLHTAKPDGTINLGSNTNPSDSSLVLKPSTNASGQEVPGEYQAILPPGTYWVGTTATGGNGQELLWQRYKFNVDVDSHADYYANADTKIILSAQTANSGLVELSQNSLNVNPPTKPAPTAPAPSSAASSTGTPSAAVSPLAGGETKQAPVQGFTKWYLDIGDIRFGTLPLTGGRLPWVFGGAGVLLAMAAMLMIRNRRRDDTNS